MSNRFKRPETNPLMNPVDFYNFYGNPDEIWHKSKDCRISDQGEVFYITEEEQGPFMTINGSYIKILRENHLKLQMDDILSKFMLLTLVRFKGDTSAAMFFVIAKLMKIEIPYIRVGVDYYKLIKKKTRYNGYSIQIKPWRKDEIKQDHGKALLNMIHKFDDFTIKPENIHHEPVINKCFNLYSEFMHNPVPFEVSEDMIPTSINIIKHIFGEQYELGLKYIKILYEFPRQILPVLVLVSKERQTGKTTFMNWIQMMFGENSTMINPSDLMSSFNDAYATKNIIMIDETVIDKSHVVEKLKSIATAKTISVSQKYISHYSVPFYGKVIICTNKETDFMRIDEEEIRFWVRKIDVIKGRRNTLIEEQLMEEIPMFIKFLSQLPDIDFSKSRMVFTMEEIKTKSLETVKEESKSGLQKEIEYLIEDFFLNTPNRKELEVTAKDIKEKWFHSNNQISISYIRKVLKEEMNQPFSESVKRYRAFDEGLILEKIGCPFLFTNNQSVTGGLPLVQEDMPF